jgi:hypothetical protein
MSGFFKELEMLAAPSVLRRCVNCFITIAKTVPSAGAASSIVTATATHLP